MRKIYTNLTRSLLYKIQEQSDVKWVNGDCPINFKNKTSNDILWLTIYDHDCFLTWSINKYEEGLVSQLRFLEECIYASPKKKPEIECKMKIDYDKETKQDIDFFQSISEREMTKKKKLELLSCIISDVENNISVECNNFKLENQKGKLHGLQMARMLFIVPEKF